MLATALFAAALPVTFARSAPRTGQAGNQHATPTAVSKAARSYEVIERDLIAQMKSLLTLRENLMRLRADAARKDREVAEAKASLNVITRIMLARRMEEYHTLLTMIEEREVEERRLADRIRTLADEAASALRTEGESPERQARLNFISGRDLERAGRDCDAAAQKLSRCETAEEKTDAQRALDRLQAERLRARRALYEFYSVPSN